MSTSRQRDQSDPSAVIIQLFRDEETGGWFVARIDLNMANICNQIVFRQREPLDKAFTKGFSSFLKRHLPVRSAAGTTVKAQETVELPYLVLGGLRVIAQKSMNGSQRVVVHFRQALGQLQALLTPEHRTEAHTLGALETTAAEALLSLLQPCLNLASVELHHLENVSLHHSLAVRLERLTAHKEDLAFFTHLLQRYIANAPKPDTLLSALNRIDYTHQLPTPSNNPMFTQNMLA